jgi:hypothetical protein
MGIWNTSLFLPVPKIQIDSHKDWCQHSRRLQSLTPNTLPADGIWLIFLPVGEIDAGRTQYMRSL